jgi:hypothetical protein|tara:strand:+ start:886 stop:1140 length:255 start_codon:yes stop_codon:yes gene_type:complete
MTKKKETKVTKQELETIQNQQNELNLFLRQIGVLAVEQRNVENSVKLISETIEKTKQELEEKYGSINIDLKDGSYTVVEEKDAK